MSYTLFTLFSFSIYIAAVISLVKFKQVDHENYPFIICTWLAAANETVSYLVSMAHGSTAFNNNVYTLLEALLITWQFSRWGIFGKQRKLYIFLICCIPLGWIAEVLLLPRGYNVFYTSVGYSLLIVLLAIETNVKIIVHYHGQLLKSHRFLICCGFMIFFTFKILVEAFWWTGLSASSTFRNEVFITISWVNLFVNLIFAAAFLWMPRKPQFIST